MASPPPHEPVTGSPRPESIASPVEEGDEHQEFIDSNMPYSPSLNSVDCHLPEYSVQPPPDYPVDQPPEVEQIVDNQPPTATEPPPENHEVKEPPLEQPPSVNVDPPESPNLITNPNPNPNPSFEPVSEPPPSPSRSPSPTAAEVLPGSPISKPPPSPSPSDKLEKSPNFDANPKAESPIEEENNDSLALMKLENSPKPSPRSPSPKSPKENSLPPLGVPLYNSITTFIPARPVISPWTHDETVNLIQAYQEKWYSIKKGPLKAGQWEEVAITVAARCGYDEPTKTSKQCRHKMEKLRKRYRQERGKPRSRAIAWDFFKLMDNLEKGPLPISSAPMEGVQYRKSSDHVNGNKRKSDVVGGEFAVSKRSARVRNSHDRGNIVNGGGLVGSLPFSDGVSRIVKGLRTPVVHKPREFYQPSYGVHKKVEEEEQEEEDDDGSDNDGGEDTVTQLAAEIKGFAEKFVRMEKNKIEMIRDVERYRMEMENKRMEMIRESQQMLVETVNRAFGGSSKTHKLSAK